MPKEPSEPKLPAGHPFANPLNVALVYVTYLLALSAGFLLQFSPPSSDDWMKGVLTFGGLVITLLLQMKFARKVWSEGRQNRYATWAAGMLAVSFVAYIVLRNAFVMEYLGRPLVIGWSLLPAWQTRCAGVDAYEMTACIRLFGSHLEGDIRADVFFGRAQISTTLTSLHLVYSLMALVLIFVITALLEMLRPAKPENST